MTEPAPEGARQALATGSSALLVVTVAFAGWWTFATDADAGLVAGLAGPAVTALAAVPALAANASGSLRLARRAYLVGAVLALAVLVAGFWQAFGRDTPEGGDTETSVRIDPHALAGQRQARSPGRA
ncbi:MULTISPECIES: hypothetical protein [Ramlibacter]|uniref:Uncharacterized protein n=1 Tax=Ramlibacter pinisoli TaxID=2682844 RepID=A0A6N8IYE3_9BURK|nr:MULTISPECIES: hypothetical protein [Ramlibacter]MBA2961904.1 hypothetical protein [Ramlibacter sp. CGMCC 1.13660]MVQ31847.1 hypothetical protein [Ramlibacter pinisoli]